MVHLYIEQSNLCPAPAPVERKGIQLQTHASTFGTEVTSELGFLFGRKRGRERKSFPRPSFPVLGSPLKFKPEFCHRSVQSITSKDHACMFCLSSPDLNSLPPPTHTQTLEDTDKKGG
jgi:hypothetical protein